MSYAVKTLERALDDVERAITHEQTELERYRKLEQAILKSLDDYRQSKHEISSAIAKLSCRSNTYPAIDIVGGSRINLTGNNIR